MTAATGVDVLGGPGGSGVLSWCASDVAQHSLRRRWVQLALDHGDLGLALVDDRGRARRCNRALERFVGYEEQELRRLPFSAYTHASDIGRNVELWQRLRSGEIGGYSFPKRYRTKPGATRAARLTVFVDAGEVYSIIDPAGSWPLPSREARLPLVAGGTGREPVVVTEFVADDLAVVRLLGEHDMASANEIADALADVADKGRTAVVDVTETQYIDSAVVNVLFRARKGIVLQFGTAAVVGIVLEITEITKAVPYAPTRDEAIVIARRMSSPGPEPTST